MAGLATLADVLHDLGLLLYGGPIVCFAVLLSLAGRLPHLQPWDLVRTYRAWGAGLGLAMGAWVPGLLLRHYLAHGAFTWSWSGAQDQLVLAGHLVFLLLWAWNIRVEVWSLEPLRKLDRNGEVSDPQAFSRATARLARDLQLQAALVLAYVVLARLAGSAA